MLIIHNFINGKTNPVVKVVSGPFAQLLPGLETGHPVTVGQSPAYDFSVSNEQKGVFLVSVSDCSVCDSCAGDWPTVTGCPVSNPGNNCANGLLDLKTFRCSTPSSVSSHERKSRKLLFLSWLLTDDGVENRNVFKSTYYLYHRICLTINKIVYYQHLLVSFEELLSLRLSDPFALVVGCINNNWLNLWKKMRVRCSKAFRLLSVIVKFFFF